MATPRQQQVLDFLWAQIDAGKPCPSYREIGAAVGSKSASAVCFLIRDLEAQGYLRRHPNHRRSIELLKRAGGGHPANQVAVKALRKIAKTSFDPHAVACARTTLILLGLPIEAPEPAGVAA